MRTFTMQVARQSGEPDQKMSPTIYAALIDSLFTDPGPMFAGALCAAVAAIMTALKTDFAPLWPCVALLILTGAMRALDTRKYQQVRAVLGPDDMPRWEVRYQVGAMLYAAALGMWCLAALLGSDDAVAHMIATSVTLCYVAAGGGRTYGRPWIFHVQMMLACGPLTAALAIHGNPYYIGLALLNVLFFLALRHISTSLQAMFVRALVAREREASLAGQFDAALNNMPHGLCMFRADGRLAVMNHRFIEMMDLSDDFVQRGSIASDICNACVLSGAISAATARQILSEIENSQVGDIVTGDPDARRNRSLSWTFQPMADGGTVVLAVDITERKDAEERQGLLAREVDHRAKNAMAIVQSIVRLTKASSMAEYANVIEGRIKALSRAHAILSDARWQGAELATLVEEELAPYRSGHSDRIHVNGPKVLLEPTTAQTLALALHELGTNAAKYGALSHAAGRLELSWEVHPDEIVLDWSETGGPLVHEPRQTGFGTKIITSSIEKQVGGEAAFEWRPEGLSCRLRVPLSHSVDVGPDVVVNLPSGPAAKQLPGERIMIVEDEALVAMILEEQLEDLGVSVAATCASVPEAMRAIEERAPQAAILDVNLRGQLVYPVADRLIDRGIPFVFVTGYGRESIDRRYSFIKVLEKPVERQALESLFSEASAPATVAM